MSRTNVKAKTNTFTHEGAPTNAVNGEALLRRSVLACLLWEKQYYEDGVDIAQRIEDCVKDVSAEKLGEIAIEAREKFKLRHVPLFLAKCMAKAKKLSAKVLERIVQRADEPAEFLSMYWGTKKTPISNQVKNGLARALTKFNEYELSKWNRDAKVKLRDVFFMTHPKPISDDQAALWKRLISNDLPAPETWEVLLSSGKDKKASWEKLLSENKLGALAILKNLRNMAEANVKPELVFGALEKMNVSRVLPFRFIAAARYAPQWEPQIEKAFNKCVVVKPKLSGQTCILVDVSGSMDDKLSSKSDLTRIDAACGVAMVGAEICEDVGIVTFSNQIVQVPPRHGFALRDAIKQSQEHGGTYLGRAVTHIHDSIRGKLKYDRIVIITDEQSADIVPPPIGRGYIINVASHQNGIGYGPYTHITGFSEAVWDYLCEAEKQHESKTENK